MGYISILFHVKNKGNKIESSTLFEDKRGLFLGSQISRRYKAIPLVERGSTKKALIFALREISQTWRTTLYSSRYQSACFIQIVATFVQTFQFLFNLSLFRSKQNPINIRLPKKLLSNPLFDYFSNIKISFTSSIEASKLFIDRRMKLIFQRNELNLSNSTAIESAYQLTHNLICAIESRMVLHLVCNHFLLTI